MQTSSTASLKEQRHFGALLNKVNAEVLRRSSKKYGSWVRGAAEDVLDCVFEGLSFPSRIYPTHQSEETRSLMGPLS